jgi:hypothetical protein
MQVESVEIRNNTAMQRNMDLVRDLLLAIEHDPQMDASRDFFISSPDQLYISGHSESEVTYHLGLLINAGFINGEMGGLLPVVRGLTWEGHEFLDNIKTDTIWSKVKTQALSQLGGVSMKMLAMLAEGEVKKHLGLLP